VKQRLFRILYWTGFLLAVAGVLLRFWPGGVKAGLALAVIGVGLLIAARIGASIRRF
jgi:drug/metabolite transporter (DMT)-like permease